MGFHKEYDILLSYSGVYNKEKLYILSTAGVPIYTNKGHGGGIHLLENYTLSKAFISERESENLLSGG